MSAESKTPTAANSDGTPNDEPDVDRDPSVQRQRAERIHDVVSESIRWVGTVAPFVLTMTYLAITAWSTTHEILLLGTRMRLPLLGAEVPVQDFFLVAPILLVVLHLFVLIQQRILSERIVSAWPALQRLDDHSADGPSRFLIPSLAAIRFASREISPWWIKWLSRLFFAVTLAMPLLILLLMQVRFLPYHDLFLVRLHKLLILVDGLAILCLWPKRLASGAPETAESTDDQNGIGGATPPYRPVVRSLRSWIVSVILITGGLLASWSFASLPDESCDRSIPGWGLVQRLFPCTAARIEPRMVRWLDQSFPDSLVLHGRDFSDLSLNGKLRLTDRELRCADLQNVVMPKADLRGSTLDGANLSGARLENANLGPSGTLDVRLLLPAGEDKRQYFAGQRQDSATRPTSLRGANLHHTDLTGAVLVLADLSNVRGANVVLRGVEAYGARVIGADLDSAFLEFSDFGGSVLHLSRFDGASMVAANLSDVAAVGASFVQASAPLSSFVRSELSGSRFAGADLRLASLQHATLRFSDLRASDLRGVRGLEVDQTLLPLADLRGAQVKGSVLLADLRSASMTTRTEENSDFLGKLQGDLQRAARSFYSAPSRDSTYRLMLREAEERLPSRPSELPQGIPFKSILKSIDATSDAAEVIRYFETLAGRARKTMCEFQEAPLPTTETSPEEALKGALVRSLHMLERESVPFDPLWQGALRSALREPCR